MKRIIYITLFIFQLYLLGCKDEKELDLVTIYNNSDHDISCYFAYGNNPVFPDTSLTKYNYTNMIPKQNLYVYDLFYTFKDAYRTAQRDTLCFYIFHTDTLRKYSWEEVSDNYKVLCRYDLSLQDIKRLNKSIYYPPTAEMSHIKMYFPYKENE